jgi:hypothetical protein
MGKKKGPTPRRPWEPLHFSHLSPEGAQIWGNGKYTVTVHVIESREEGDPPMHLLGIHTRTRATVGAHDWRHFQAIKNQLCGEERLAVEIYPPESQLVDEANEYWLWVLPEGAFLSAATEYMGIGFNAGRTVGGANPEPHKAKWRQRPLEEVQW